MSAFHAALGGMVTVTGVGMVVVGRTWPTRGQHRAPALDDPTLLDELLGPLPQAAPHAAVVQAWRDCPTCVKATAGVVTADGWWCGECLQPAITIHTTTGDHR